MEENGHTIKDTRDGEFVKDIKNYKKQRNMMMLLVKGTSLIILIGVLNLIFVKKMLQKR